MMALAWPSLGPRVPSLVHFLPLPLASSIKGILSLVDLTDGQELWLPLVQSDGLGSASETVPTCGLVIILALFVAAAQSVVLSMPLSEKALSPCKTPQARSEPLPFPGKLVDGRYDFQYLDLLSLPLVPSHLFALTSLPLHRKQPKRTLVSWCNEFKLPQSGNVSMLASHLVEFSNDWEHWEER
jgi:hypothetical protein